MSNISIPFADPNTFAPPEGFPGDPNAPGIGPGPAQTDSAHSQGESPRADGFPNYTTGVQNRYTTGLGYSTPSGINDSVFLQAALGYSGENAATPGAAGLLGRTVLVDYGNVVAGANNDTRGLTDVFGDPSASTTDADDKIHGLAHGTGNHQVTLGEALSMPMYEDPALISSLQARLWTAGYYGNTTAGRQDAKDQTKPFADGVYDAQTQDAYKKLLLDSSDAATNGKTVDDLLNEKASQNKDISNGAAGAVRPHGVNSVITLDKTGDATLGTLTDKLATAILGSKLSDEDKQAIIGQVQHIEAFNQLPDAVAKMNADNANHAIDNSGYTTQPGSPSDIVKAAQGLLGTPYFYGGKDPKTGLDCSGFTQTVFKQFGVDIGGDTSAQRANPNVSTVGNNIGDLKNAHPGDLLFFGDAAGEHAHVGIYIGNRQMISAANGTSGTIVSSVDGWNSSGEELNQIGRVRNVAPSATAAGGGTGVTLRQFATDVLSGLGIEPSDGAIKAIAGWAKAEGGSAAFNPLNTTQDSPGSSSYNDNGGNPVKNYASYQAGVQATVATLGNGRYGNVLEALKSGNPTAVAQAVGNSPWGTSGDTMAQTVQNANPDETPANFTGGAAPIGGAGTPAGDGVTTDKYEGGPSLAVKTSDNQQALVEQQLKKDHPAAYDATQLDSQFQNFLSLIGSAGATQGVGVGGV